MNYSTVESLFAGDPEVARQQLALREEDQWFDRKSVRIRPQDLAKTLVAFANAEGGHVFVGASDGGALEDLPTAANNELREAAILFTHPPVQHEVHELRGDTGTGLVFSVPPSEEVHEVAGGECYCRIGDSNKKLPYAARQQLEWARKAGSYESEAESDVSIADLDQAQLEQFRKRLGSSTSQQALIARDLINRKDQVRRAGVLLLAADPQREYPQAYIRVLKYSSAERGTGRFQNLEAGGDIRIAGSLSQQIERARVVIGEMLPARRALGYEGVFVDLPMIPEDVWLEGVVNAVAHRAYGYSDHIRVEIFPNRLEISNPGRFPANMNPNQPSKVRRNSRNPRISRVLADLGITQELGEGLPRMFEEMQKAGLTPPRYRQNDFGVELVLSATAGLSGELQQSLSATALRVLALMQREAKPLGTGEIEQALQISRPTLVRALGQLQQKGVVRWNGRSRNDPRANWELL